MLLIVARSITQAITVITGCAVAPALC